MGELIFTESDEPSSDHHIPGMNRYQILISGDVEADIRLSDDAMEELGEAVAEYLPTLVELIQEDPDSEW